MKNKIIDQLKRPGIPGHRPMQTEQGPTKNVKYMAISVRPLRSLTPIKNWRSTSLFETKILPQHPALNKDK